MVRVYTSISPEQERFLGELDLGWGPTRGFSNPCSVNRLMENVTFFTIEGQN